MAADTKALVPRVPSELRDRVIDRLSAAFAEGTIDTEEFERRVTVAHRSGEIVEVEALVADLPAGTRAERREVVPAGQAPQRARAMSVFGSTRRAGRWSVPRQLEVRAVFGNVELDFRNAVLPAGAVELDLRAVFGNIEITVPPHLAVEAEGNAVLGNFDHVERASPELPPDAPVLRIKGTSVFANVEIQMRLPGETLPRVAGRPARAALPPGERG
jgi:hypothetical protein